MKIEKNYLLTPNRQYTCSLLKSRKSTFKTGHQTDPLSSYRSDFNDGKTVSEDQRGAQNLFLGLGVRTVTWCRDGRMVTVRWSAGKGVATK